jgi:periplasmic protein TonB
MERKGRPLFETGVINLPARNAATMPVSMGIHAAIAAAVVVIPLLGPTVQLPPAINDSIFFVRPTIAPEPPPPVALGPACKACNTAATNQAKATNIVAPPRDIPDGLPENPIELGGLMGGDPNGVDGGLVGSQGTGQVIGGLPPLAHVDPPPVRVGGDVREPRKLRDVAPAYPRPAIAAHIEGSVVVEFTITPQGRVAGVHVARSHALFDQAAIDAVQQWIYTPTLLNGVPVPVLMTVTVNFSFRR